MCVRARVSVWSCRTGRIIDNDATVKRYQFFLQQKTQLDESLNSLHNVLTYADERMTAEEDRTADKREREGLAGVRDKDGEFEVVRRLKMIARKGVCLCCV